MAPWGGVPWSAVHWVSVCLLLLLACLQLLNGLMTRPVVLCVQAFSNTHQLPTAALKALAVWAQA